MKLIKKPMLTPYSLILTSYHLILNPCRLLLNPYPLILNSYSLILAAFLLACAAGFAEAGSTHAFGRAAGNCGGVWKLPDTGQTICYDGAGGEIGCAALAQDGTYSPSAIQPSYTIQSVGTSSVTVDNVTGLMWKTNTEELGGVFVTSGTYAWENAITVCTVKMNSSSGYANYTDWRLPNVKELVSIVDYSRYNPSINMAYFPNTKISYYWSSTTIGSNSRAWFVYFSNGYMVDYDKTDEEYVRCVRAGP